MGYSGLKKGLGALAALAVSAFISVGSSHATLVLEGSDATGVHSGDASSVIYTTQLFAFMAEGSALPILVFGSAGSTANAPAGTVFTTDLTGLSTADYSGLYIQSPGGCCSQNLAGALPYAAQIAAFFAAGGSVAIMDYQGGDWSSMFPILGTPPAGALMGFGTGGGGPNGSDNEVFNADGLAKGFTQPGALGSWEHQAYSTAYFVDTLGFLSLVDAGPEYFGLNADGSAKGSAFLALGGALGTGGCTDPAGCGTGQVPEPAPITFLGLGLIALGISRRRRGRFL